MDQFKVGDKVWCSVFGEGLVVATRTQDAYPVRVKFGSYVEGYTTDGKLFTSAKNRTLFFSEPKIEAATERPFAPTLNGKFVVVTPYKFSDGYLVGTVHDESEDHFFLDTGHKVMKNDLVRIQEISKENLLQ